MTFDREVYYIYVGKDNNGLDVWRDDSGNKRNELGHGVVGGWDIMDNSQAALDHYFEGKEIPKEWDTHGAADTPTPIAIGSFYIRAPEPHDIVFKHEIEAVMGRDLSFAEYARIEQASWDWFEGAYLEDRRDQSEYNKRHKEVMNKYALFLLRDDLQRDPRFAYPYAKSDRMKKLWPFAKSLYLENDPVGWLGPSSHEMTYVIRAVHYAKELGSNEWDDIPRWIDQVWEKDREAFEAWCAEGEPERWFHRYRNIDLQRMREEGTLEPRPNDGEVCS